MAKTLLLCAFLVQSVVAIGATAEPLSASAQKVSEGFINLSWKDLDTSSLILEVGTDAEMRDVTRTLTLVGQNQVHLSGFEDGVYFARLQDGAGTTLSNTIRFEVEHRSLQSASLLFAIGAGLFAFLLVTLFRFTRSNS